MNNKLNKANSSGRPILFVLGHPNPFSGAGWTRVGFLVNFWSSKGHKIDVLGSFSYKSRKERGKKRTGNITFFNIIFSMPQRYPIFFIFNCFLSFLISSIFLFVRTPHTVVVSIPPGDVGLGAMIACNFFKIKCVADYRDEWEDYLMSITNSNFELAFFRFIKKLMSLIFIKISIVTTVTNEIVDSLKKRGVTKVQFIPNGADVNIFKPSKSKESDYFIIIYVLGSTSYYNLDLTLNAIDILGEKIKNLKLILIGKTDPNKSMYLRNLDKVFLFGEINNQMLLSKIIAQGDVGLIPLSIHYSQAKTSLPVKFFEYCACGLPVVATVPDQSVLAKVIKMHRIGLTVPSMDKNLFSEAIFQLYLKKSFREKAGKNARLLIEKRYDRNKIAEEFYKLAFRDD